MIIIREVFTAKPGQASKLAKLFKKGFANVPNSRVLTDYIGNYNTVIMETEMSNLTEFDKLMNDYKAGKLDPNMDPEVAKEMSNYTDMYVTGRREVFQVIE